MTEHHIEPVVNNLKGYFSRNLAPILSIQSGDTIISSTPDANANHIIADDPFGEVPKLEGYDSERNPGHCLIGPIAIEGARVGMTLEIQFKEIVTGNWGWTSAGWNEEWNAKLNVPNEYVPMRWALDNDKMTARNPLGYEITTKPFLGLIGMPPDEAGELPTRPPRFCGGNIDCKELVEGSTLYLPISVDGCLLMFGDGHAAQGDGEVAGPAIECGMSRLVMDFHLHEDLHLTMPRAYTPAAWITFGFNEDLDIAYFQALSGMLDLMTAQYDISRTNAYNMASAVVDLHITQVVNLVKGVHAILPHDAIRKL